MKLSEINELHDWFLDCGHEIILSKSNKGATATEITGIAIHQDTKQTYKASGKSEGDVLKDLRNMLCGKYYG